MRIVSLVPSATEIAWAVGLAGDLVAVTHDCDFPPSVRGLPRVTSTTIPSHATSSEIDALVRSAGERGESTFHVDVDALRAARPDVILGQTICRVCAVTIEQLPSDASFAPRTIPLTGESIEGVLADIRRVAVELGVADRGDSVVADLRARLDAVSQRVEDASRPRVACLEWLDPLFNGGHWVPEQVALAGGIDVLGSPAERSRVIEWDEVVGARPDVLVLMPCGFDVQRTVAEAGAITARAGFGDLPAACSGRVIAVNGSAYFSRPGPRLVDGVEVLAGVLHPELFPPPPSDAAVPLLRRSAPAMRAR
jgi:iron complex transport system substrate-binding protein